MLGVVVSRADAASVRIGERMRDLVAFDSTRDESRPDAAGGGAVFRADGVTIREFEALHLDLERPADAFADLDLLMFASRHAGETGPLLTAHHTGNVGPADHGGEPNELARACPNAHRRVLVALDEYAPDGYDVGMECTHHGPSEVGAPSMFVEIGSGPAQWDDPDAARAAARAILDLRGVAADRPVERGGGADADRRHLLGVGGGHYAPRFERIVRETDWAVGHVLADWGLQTLGDRSSPESRALLSEALDESRAAYALVEGDGDSRELAATVEAAGARVVGETWVRETDGVALPLVRRVEADVAAVDEGLRFGDRAAGYDGDFVVASLPGELLAEARGIDRETVRALVDRETLAFGTDQSGTRVTGPAVLREDGERERLVAGLIDVLRERYDEVERIDRDGDGDESGGPAVFARETAFAPEKAATLGVPEGPKFGRLAAGEPVEVDGETIPPEAVSEERERRFPL
jgi:D-aminoacyl-tRNA deacylase